MHICFKRGDVFASCYLSFWFCFVIHVCGMYSFICFLDMLCVVVAVGGFVVVVVCLFVFWQVLKILFDKQVMQPTVSLKFCILFWSATVRVLILNSSLPPLPSLPPSLQKNREVVNVFSVVGKASFTNMMLLAILCLVQLPCISFGMYFGY